MKTWLVGGCVRDALLKKTSTDIDLAYAGNIDDFKNTLITLGVTNFWDHKARKYGGIHFSYKGVHFDATFLRKDTLCDGRHASVQPTLDLKTDALRRDFTMNALYYNGNQLDDFFSGINDLQNKQINFIGDPDQRINEDYLRILRFTRLLALINAKPDSNIIDIVKHNGNKLAYLSGTVIWQELKKIFSYEYRQLSINFMHLTLLDKSIFLQPFHHLKVPKGLDNPVAVLSILCRSIPVDYLKQRLNLTKEETAKCEIFHGISEKTNIAEIYLNAGENSARNAVYIQYALFSIPPEITLSKPYWHVPNPHFPLKGRDIISLGVSPSPKINEILSLTRMHWLENNLNLSKENCLAYAKKLISGN